MKKVKHTLLSVLFTVLFFTGSVMPVNADMVDDRTYVVDGIGFLLIFALIIAAICVVAAILIRKFKNRKK